MKFRPQSLFIIVLLMIGGTSTALAHQLPIKAIRFDPGYYYDLDGSVEEFAGEQVDLWASKGVNTVYYLLHSNDGGARYRTYYPYNNMEDFGRMDMLGAILDAAHAKDIKVVGWLFDRQHKQAWMAHPEWRVKDASGNDYKERNEDYFLSPFNEAAMRWYMGMIRDLMKNYPDLDGIDMAESLLNWWGNKADFNPAAIARFTQEYPGSSLASSQWLQFRADGLTRHLTQVIAMAHRHNMDAHITTIMTANAFGQLISNTDQMRYTGFDLDGILNSRQKPDYLNVELIWQQWMDEHNSGVFDPTWTAQATTQALANVAERCPIIVHVEASTFGNVTPAPGDILAALAAAKSAGVDDVDCYDTALLDDMNAWSEIASNYKPTSNVNSMRIASTLELQAR